MNRSVFSLLLLALTALTGCGGSPTFYDFTAPDGTFRCKLPANPVSNAKNLGPVRTQTWETVGGAWNIAAGVIELPADSSSMGQAEKNQALNNGVQGMATNINARVISQSDVTYNGYSGREVELDVPPETVAGKTTPATTAVVRLYLVKSRVYMLFVRSTRKINKGSPEVLTVFNSFALTDASPAPGSGTAPSTAPAAPNQYAGSPGGYTPGATAPPASMPMPGTYAPPGATASASPTMPPSSGAYAPNSNYSPSGSYAPNGATGTMPPTAAGHSAVPPGAVAGNYGGTNNPMSPMPVPGTNGYPATGAGYTPGGATATAPPMTGTIPPTAAGHSAVPPGAVAGNYGGTNNPASPMPVPGTNGYPATGIGYTPGGAIPGSPMGTPGVPGQQGNQLAFTGTPVTADMKITVGDKLQVIMNGKWVDVKVQVVAPNGLLQVCTLARPPVFDMVSRDILQVPPGGKTADMLASETPSDDPAPAPKTSTAGLPSSKKSASKSSGFSKPSPSASATTTAKAETTKPAGLISIDGATVEELLKIIANKNEHRRVAAAEKLRDHGDASPNPDVSKKLLELLKTNELTVKAAVAQALEKWVAPEDYDAVKKNLTGGTTEVRQSMMRILAANKVDGAADRIADCLADKDDRKVASESLVALGDASQEAVIRMLNNKDGKVKAAACEILAQIGTDEARAALKKATETWTGTDRIAARKALQSLDGKK